MLLSIEIKMIDLQSKQYKRKKNLKLALPEFSSLLEIVSQDIEQKLRVGFSVDMTMSASVQIMTKLGSIDQVSIL